MRFECFGSVDLRCVFQLECDLVRHASLAARAWTLSPRVRLWHAVPPFHIVGLPLLNTHI